MSELVSNIERLSEEARDMVYKADDALNTLEQIIDKVGTIEHEEYSNEDRAWAYEDVRLDLYEVSSALSEVRDYADVLETKVDQASDDVNDKLVECEEQLS